MALREDFPPSRNTYISQLAIAFLTAIQESCSIKLKPSIGVERGSSSSPEYPGFTTRKGDRSLQRGRLNKRASIFSTLGLLGAIKLMCREQLKLIGFQGIF
ncbi:MAG: hypothetical protein AB1861_22610 [Cyanobacteriota bacterium]